MSSNNPGKDYLRRNPRVPVNIVVESGQSRMPLCFATNISASGMRIETSQPPDALGIGTTLQLRFHLPFGQHPVQTAAVIRSIDLKPSDPTMGSNGSPVELGVEFSALDEAGHREIDAYVQKYKSAQQDQVAEIKASGFGGQLETRESAYYLKRLADMADKEVADHDPIEKAIYALVSRLTPAEREVLRGKDISALPSASVEVLRNTLALVIKLFVEVTEIKERARDGNPADRQILMENLRRVVTFEADICIEGLQQIHGQAIKSDDDNLKRLCSA